MEKIEFPTLEGSRAVELPASSVSDIYTFFRKLRDAGAVFPPADYEEIRKALRRVAATPTKQEFVYEAQTGWTADLRTFVCSDRAFGQGAAKIQGVTYDEGRANVQFHTSGTWKSWRREVAKHSSLSSVFVTAICAAFAAPLLKIVGERNFAICLWGKSHTGKTIATLLASSVIGQGTREMLLDWDMTPSGLAERMVAFNDSLAPIDDFQRMRADDAYKRIKDVTYQLASGAGTRRFTSYNRTHSKTDERWRSIVVTSSEFSIQDMARKRSGAERQPGELARLIDVAVLDDDTHIFDRLKAIPAHFGDWKTTVFKSIVDGCAANHGAAFHHYVAYLLEKKGTLRNTATKSQADFVARVIKPTDDDIKRGIASKFGLLFAGGKLAISCGLVPWSETTLLDSIASCYRRAIKMLPDEATLLQQGLAALGQRLKSLPEYSSDKASLFTPEYCEKLPGYRCSVWGARQPHILKRHVFDALFVSAEQRLLVEQHLMSKGWLTVAMAKRAKALAPKEQFQWPDAKRRRSLEIRWPKPA
jgi:hypothetical protein